MRTLANNWHWAWSHSTQELFTSIDAALFAKVGKNPSQLLAALSPAQLAGLAKDDAFTAAMNDEAARLGAYLEQTPWYDSVADAPEHIAYFSPEFGVDGSLPQYSGGLGILAGDHLKSASDLGVPLTGVGLFYRDGYFHQEIGADGWQRERYSANDPEQLGLTLLTDGDEPVEVSLQLSGERQLFARIWIAQIGRVPLLLLDTQTPSNSDELRLVTDRLYGGGSDHRLLQETLLGIGGVRAVRAYATLSELAQPDVFHTNEGHAGFQGLERLGELMRGGLDFDQALAVVRASTVFTTHTPVPAGIDRFELSAVSALLNAGIIPDLDVDRSLALGTENYEGGDPAVFNMAVLGLHLGQHANGVSLLHGTVSRGMFRALWPSLDQDDVPITSITNGVHAPTWVHPTLSALSATSFDTSNTTAVDWRDTAAVSDEALWSARQSMKRDFIDYARAHIASNDVSGVLDPHALTIGFARRVPTYKRLTLMLRDPERLTALLTNPQRPVQIVVAGKSHPADHTGKVLIQQLVRFSKDPRVRGRIVFLPDYDITMAKILYPGCDVWLNNPLRPLEACGTSGMKAALNGALNLSILDGWWDEWYDGHNGWAIPSADDAETDDERDDREADNLYDLLEQQVVPRFFSRIDDVPAHWLTMVRHTMATLGKKATSDRMVSDYVNRLYAPTARLHHRVAADDFAEAKQLAAFTTKVRGAWSTVSAVLLEPGSDEKQSTGSDLVVRAQVAHPGLEASDLLVEAVYGEVAGDGSISSPHVTPLQAEETSEGQTVFVGTLSQDVSGHMGVAVRVTPRSELLANQFELGLIAVSSAE